MFDKPTSKNSPYFVSLHGYTYLMVGMYCFSLSSLESFEKGIIENENI